MRYIIGIDLGTTNSCLAYIDRQKLPQTIQQFQIPQLTKAGYVESLSSLPSCCYLTSDREWPENQLNLPWKTNPSYFVGAFALSQGAKVPTRLVHSAKSWLSHTSAQRRDKILPFGVVDAHQTISPVEASARYLEHLKAAWNATMALGKPDDELQQQDIILTVPASFDEVARLLTVEAARQAGFEQLTLVEEPQAAFYYWISRHEKDGPTFFEAGTTILVCDIGGGTTDFSLIEVVKKEEQLIFQRLAVGHHLLLGGDNMDMAIAHYIEAKLIARGETPCSPLQWIQLRQQARLAKEKLLATKVSEKKEGQQEVAAVFNIQLLGTGSSVIQGSLSLEIHRQEILNLLKEGFFEVTDWETSLKIKQRSVLRTPGLPYEEDPSITKQLARFLKNCHRQPDYLLYNGGTLKPPLFQEALVQALNLWFPEKKVKLLTSNSLDFAVARGAAYYGKARRGEGIRITSGLSCTYYLAVEQDKKEKALTLLTRQAEEGAIFEPEQLFWVQPNQPISFKLLTSHVRLEDQPGTVLEINEEEIQVLAPIQTLLRFGKKQRAETQQKIPVRLGIALTALGTVEIWLKSQTTSHRWTLEFQIRTATGQEQQLKQFSQKEEPDQVNEIFDKQVFEKPRAIIQAFYQLHPQNQQGELIKPAKVMELLEQELSYPKAEWSLGILRALADEIVLQAPQRKRSALHEARWWNLVGFCLRPGTGYPLDDFRLKNLWKIILADRLSSSSIEIQIQRWICYRRVANGFNRGQQLLLAHELNEGLWDLKTGRLVSIKNKSEEYLYAEKIRALANLELIEPALKVKLGQALINKMKQTPLSSAEKWALARLGARQLIQGSNIHVVPVSTCQAWLETLLELNKEKREDSFFIMSQLARKTACRELNISIEIRDKILDFYKNDSHFERLKTLLIEGSSLTEKEQTQLFGEQLPLGISLDEN